MPIPARCWQPRSLPFLAHAEGLSIHFLSAFGGVGSLNDVVLDPRSDDERFYALEEDAWVLATTLKREDEADA
jgi:hypothetical protein